MTKERHVLGLSGGRDSAALAVYMRQNYPDIDIDYFFTDTGKELPEVYEFLVHLEGFLGKTIIRLNGDRDFDFWLKQYNNFLPSQQARWCTRQMKIKPFEDDIPWNLSVNFLLDHNFPNIAKERKVIPDPIDDGDGDSVLACLMVSLFQIL